jgi:hypothetical protein
MKNKTTTPDLCSLVEKSIIEHNKKIEKLENMILYILSKC